MAGSSSGSEAKPAWDSYAPQGSKRRQVLQFLGVGSASKSWFSLGRKSADAARSQPAEKAQSTSDSTQSLANYFSPSRRADLGPEVARVRTELADIGEEDDSTSAQWQDESKKFAKEQKRSLWVTPAFYVPGSRGKVALALAIVQTCVVSGDVYAGEGMF